MKEARVGTSRSKTNSWLGSLSSWFFFRKYSLHPAKIQNFLFLL